MKHEENGTNFGNFEYGTNFVKRKCYD